MLTKYDLDANGTGHVFLKKKQLVDITSEFQKIEISDLDILGRVLVLDNIIQLSELDCDRYHETFAHLPMSCVEAPTRALVLGGGDGILAKELLKYEGLEIDIVDIDESVCTLSAKYLSHLNDDAFGSARVYLYNEDAIKFCKDTDKKYDVIFGDITDPHPDSPSNSLLGVGAIEIYKKRLKPGGILAIQTDNPQIAPEHFVTVKKTLSKCFSQVGDFATVALTLSSVFSFAWATDGNALEPSPLRVKTSWLNDERINFCFEAINVLLGEK